MLEDRLLLNGTVQAYKDGNDLKIFALSTPRGVPEAAGIQITAGSQTGEYIVTGIPWAGFHPASSAVNPTQVWDSPNYGAALRSSVVVEGITGDFNIVLKEQDKVVLSNLTVPGKLHMLVAGRGPASIEDITDSPNSSRTVEVDLNHVIVRQDMTIERWAPGPFDSIWQSSINPDPSPTSDYTAVHLNIDGLLQGKLKLHDISQVDVRLSGYFESDVELKTEHAGSTVTVDHAGFVKPVHFDLGKNDSNDALTNAQIQLFNGGPNTVRISDGNDFFNDLKVDLHGHGDTIHAQDTVFEGINFSGDASTAFDDDGNNIFYQTPQLNGGIRWLKEISEPLVASSQSGMSATGTDASSSLSISNLAIDGSGSENGTTGGRLPGSSPSHLTAARHV
jgi:hypothetical protein